MKKSLSFLALGALAALTLANVRTYTDAPDPTRQDHTITGVVLIVPAPDMCYGIEWEHGTNFISPFGGAYE